MAVHNYNSRVTGINGLDGTMAVTTDDATHAVTGISYKTTPCTILPGTTRDSLQFMYNLPSLSYNFHGALVGQDYHGTCVLAGGKAGKRGPADPDNWTASSTGAGAAAHGKAGY